MSYRPLPIGVDDFRKIITENYYYVDKTNIIKDVIDKKGEVNLFTRPRRFGKTLAISTLRCFFEEEHDFQGKIVDNAALFEGLNIAKQTELCEKYQGKYPVIQMSLKSGKQDTYEKAYEMLTDEISKEFIRHRYVLSSEAITDAEKEKYIKIMDGVKDENLYLKSLEFLSAILAKSVGKNVIILVDEYDVPLENAYFCNFYDKMVSFIRSLFESALKTNPYLELSVITGYLRITRESIFTGLNNLKIISILNPHYGEYFGFTEEEVRHMLKFYDMEDCGDAVKRWYDGYLFGTCEVYNPWSVINYIDTSYGNYKVPMDYAKPYWANTSGNSIIHALIERADHVVKSEIENLIEGGTVEKPVHEEITYGDIYKNMDNLWNFLFFTGYLKEVSIRSEGDIQYVTLAIPDAEVRYIYKNMILEWFQERMETKDMTAMYEAILTGDVAAFQLQVNQELSETISFFDYAENYYHGFLSGLLKGMKGYYVESNKEYGLGRPDVVIRTMPFIGKAIIMEVKYTRTFAEMEAMADAALQQIEEGRYEEGLRQEGYKEFIRYGIAFYKKSCVILKQ